jgi:hypothetical protein
MADAEREETEEEASHAAFDAEQQRRAEAEAVEEGQATMTSTGEIMGLT